MACEPLSGMRLRSTCLRCSLLRTVTLGDSLIQLLRMLYLCPPAPRLQQLTIRCRYSIAKHHLNNQDVCHQVLWCDAVTFAAVLRYRRWFPCKTCAYLVAASAAFSCPCKS